MLGDLRTHAATRLARHLRSPALVWLALATPILAVFLIPDATADYALIGMNGKRLALDAGSLGLQLGVLVAVLATPLAYIYLRAGPARIEPREVQVPTPGSRVGLQLGAWIGDSLAIWLWLLALGVAGVILSAFRTDAVAPLQTLLPVMLVGAPAFAITAAVFTLFSSRPWLGGWLGDILFFFVWMALLVVSVALASGIAANPVADPFGYSTSLVAAASEPVRELYIGGAPTSDAVLDIDAMAGVLSAGYLTSRAAWLGIAAGVAAFGGLVFSPRMARAGRAPAAHNPATESWSLAPVPAARGGAGLPNLVAVQLGQALGTPLGRTILLAGVVAVALLPFRGLGGAVGLLSLIALCAAPPATWRRTPMLDTMPIEGVTRAASALATIVAICGTVGLVALARALAAGDTEALADIAVTVPVAAAALFALGHITRSAVAGRLVGFALWYGYLNFALQ